jgi:hypothetical protein
MCKLFQWWLLTQDTRSRSVLMMLRYSELAGSAIDAADATASVALLLMTRIMPLLIGSVRHICYSSKCCVVADITHC